MRHLLLPSVDYFDKICPVYLTCHANCNQRRIKSFASTCSLIFHKTRKAYCNGLTRSNTSFGKIKLVSFEKRKKKNHNLVHATVLAFERGIKRVDGV